MGRGRKRKAFTLRFENEATPEALRLVARARRKSMNALIEEMVERELGHEVRALELELSETLEALRRYGGKPESDWAAFARAEGEIEDPIQARRVTVDDPYGVNAVFA